MLFAIATVLAFVGAVLAQPPGSDPGNPPPGDHWNHCCIEGCDACWVDQDCGPDLCENNWYFSVCCSESRVTTTSSNGTVETISVNAQGKRITFVTKEDFANMMAGHAN